jgi:hypothetical protein
MSRSVEPRTMFSKPLAYPSTLDRAISGCACRLIAVLRGGALEPEPRTLSGKKRRLTHTLIYQRYFKRQAPRVFLSQAGPRFDLELVQAEHHLGSDVD